MPQSWARSRHLVAAASACLIACIAGSTGISAQARQGTAEKGWPSALLDELKTIPADQFEAVDTAPMMTKPNSGEAHQP